MAMDMNSEDEALVILATDDDYATTGVKTLTPNSVHFSDVPFAIKKKRGNAEKFGKKIQNNPKKVLYIS